MMGNDLSRAPHHRAGDRLLAAYLAATGLLAAATLTGRGAALAAAHAVAAAVLLRAAASGSGDAPGTDVRERGGGGGPSWPGARLRRRAGRFFRVFLPVAVTPLLYSELELLNQLVSPGYLDPAVQGWEAAVFGQQISLTAARRFGSLWLSEALHFGYVSYYLVVPGAAVAVYRNRGEAGLARMSVTVGLAFFVCYLCFAVFPVAGPRYEFARIAGPQSDGLFFSAVHTVLEAGSSKGTAFPSSHVAAAAAALLACWRDARRWFWAFLVPVALLTAGTVYGRFHYGVDAAAGLAVALAAYASAPALARRLAGGGGPASPAGGGGAAPGRDEAAGGA